MKIEDIIQMVQDINKVAFTEKERKKLEKNSLKISIMNMKLLRNKRKF